MVGVAERDWQGTVVRRVSLYVRLDASSSPNKRHRLHENRISECVAHIPSKNANGAQAPIKHHKGAAAGWMVAAALYVRHPAAGVKQAVMDTEGVCYLSPSWLCGKSACL